MMMNRLLLALSFGAVALSLAACGGAQIAPLALPASTHSRHAALNYPATLELSYTLGGAARSRHPFIEVFDARDKSQHPKPLYTVGPRGGGQYGLLRVDANDKLYAVNYFANGAELDVFPSGATKPSLSCVTAKTPSGFYLTSKTLYLTYFYSDTIDEYKLPLTSGKDCLKPESELTDERAKLRTKYGLFGVTGDPAGNLFDNYQTQGVKCQIDEFLSGSKNARAFVHLGDSGSTEAISDAKGNFIVPVYDYHKRHVALAVFPKGSKIARLFQPKAEGIYGGLALGKDGSELFAATDYPTPAIDVFAYDPANAKIGALKRINYNVWFQNSVVAVYAGK